MTTEAIIRALPRRVQQRLALARLQGTDGYHDGLVALAAGDASALAQWSAPLVANEREARNRLIFGMWLGGETERNIAQNLLLSQRAVSDVVQNSTLHTYTADAIADSPPIYNVWNFSTCDPRFGQKHPGQIPGQAVVNLLLWLTQPFDFVVDPMAGGGTTLDVCKYLYRRYRCLDIDPRRPDIHQWDIRQGYPHLPQKPALIFLDPPYWRLKRDEYSKDGSAIGSYGDWLSFMDKLARDSFKTLQRGGYACLMVEDFLDEKETGRFLFLNRDCLDRFEKAGFRGMQNVAVNMPSQIKSFRDVDYAKRRGILLDLKRELLIFKKVE